MSSTDNLPQRKKPTVTLDARVAAIAESYELPHRFWPPHVTKDLTFMTLGSSCDSASSRMRK